MKYDAREELLKRLRKQQRLKEDVSWEKCIKYLREKFGIKDDIAPYKQLRLLRVKLNLTQAEMLELCDTNEESNISRWERQITVPRAADRENLFKYFGIPVDAWDARREKKFILQRALHEQELPYPAIWNIPFERPSLFVGREGILTRLHKALIEGQTPSLTQKISGLGGMGKTIAAVEYAYTYRHEYNAVLWCAIPSQDQIRPSFAKLAAEINLREKNLQNVDRVIKAVQEWMRKEEGWLLILDNVEQIADVHTILPTARRGHVIITSRSQEISNSIINIELDQLTSESGAVLLLRKAEMLGYTEPLENASDTEQEQAKKISEDMGGLPLALDTSGAYIKEVGCDLQEFSELYHAQPMKPLRWQSTFSSVMHAYPHNVANVWSLSFDRVQESSEASADLLRFYSFLAPDDIPNELAIAGASELGSHLVSIVDVEALNKAQVHLLRYSLVNRHPQQKSVSIHRLVQLVYKDKMDESTQRVWKERTIKAVYHAFAIPQHQHMQQRDRYIPHVQLCLDYSRNELIFSQEAFALFIDMGVYLRQRALYAQAEAFCTHAVTIVERMRPPFHSDRATALANLGNLYHAQGRYKEAVSVYQQVILIWEKNPPDPADKALYAVSLSNLAKSLLEQGKLVLAEQYALNAVEAMKNLLQAEFFEKASCMSTLARIYREQEKFAEAEEYYRQALALHEQQVNKDDVEIALLLNNIASVCVALGKVVESEPLNRQAITLLRASRGNNHPSVAHCLICLGDYYSMYKKDFSEAIRLNQEALAIYLDCYKDVETSHPDIFEPLANLAVFHHKQGQLKEADTFYQQALQVVEKYPYLDAAWVAYGYSALLRIMKKTSESEQMRQRAQAMERERQRRATSVYE